MHPVTPTCNQKKIFFKFFGYRGGIAVCLASTIGSAWIWVWCCFWFALTMVLGYSLSTAENGHRCWISARRQNGVGGPHDGVAVKLDCCWVNGLTLGLPLIERKGPKGPVGEPPFYLCTERKQTVIIIANGPGP